MKTLVIVISLLIIIAVILLFILGVISKKAEPPALDAGRLPSCPNKPNCVCSEQQQDKEHFVAPIMIAADNASQVIPRLKEIIGEMGGHIQHESEDYLASTFTSRIFGFVDDLQIRIDAANNLLHIRSASRVGHGDLGANRKRVELLKQLYDEKVYQGGSSPNTRTLIK